MARIAFSTVGDTPFGQLLGHNPEILANWNRLEAAFYTKSVLSAELKEQVRRTLAYGNGCEYCMAKGKPADHHPDLKVSLAVAFAQMVNQNHRTLDDSVFAVLRTEFNEQEIAELCAYVSFITASQMFGAMLQLQPS